MKKLRSACSREPSSSASRRAPRLGFTLVWGFLLALFASTAHGVGIALETDTPLLNVGQTFSVRIVVGGAKSLFGASMKITFDEARLDYRGASVGDLFLFGAKFPPLIDVKESGDTLAVATSRNVDDDPVTRDGVLVELEFAALATGVARLSIDPNTVVMVTKQGTPIEGSDAPFVAPLTVLIGDGLLLDPDSGTARMTTLASAAGFLPNEEVQVTIDGEPIGSPARTDADGILFEWPVRIPLLPGGPKEIAVEGLETGRRYTATYALVPTFRSLVPFFETPDGSVFEPQEGHTPVYVGPGVPVRIVADGFAAEETVTYEIGGMAVRTILSGEKASPLGRVESEILLPTDLPAGPAEMVAQGRSSRLVAHNRRHLQIIPRILDVVPSAGGVGARIQVAASGFTPDETIDVFFDGNPVPEASGAVVDGRGSVRTAFVLGEELIHRSEYGAVPIVLKSPSGAAASAPFVYTPIAQVTEVLPDGGDLDVVPNERVRIRGTGFRVNEPVHLRFDGDAIDLGGATTNAQGELDITFAVPLRPAGTYDAVVGTGLVDVTVPGFRVVGAITRAVMQGGSTPTIGAFGTLLEVEGAGFAPDEEIVFDLGQQQAVHSTRTRADGTFRAGIVLPRLLQDLPTGTGEVRLVARGRSGNAETTVFIASPTASSLTNGTIRVEPSTAGVGDTLHITGTGFEPEFLVGRILIDSLADGRLTPMTLPIDAVTAGRTTASGLETDGNGVFQVRVTLPPLAADGQAGEKEIMTELPVEDPNAATPRPAIAVSFTLKPSARLVDPFGRNATSVSPGDTLIAHAAGFLPLEAIAANIGSSTVILPQGTDSVGRLNGVQFVVPGAPGGNQTLQLVGQQSGITADIPITVTPTLRVLTPPSGSLVQTGTFVQVEGFGFPDGTVSFDVNGVPLSPGGAVVPSNGHFTTTFTVFAGPLPTIGSIHAVVGNLGATTQETLQFAATELTITPTSGPIGTVVRVTGATSNFLTFGETALGTLRNAALIGSVWSGEFTVPSVPGGTYEVILGTPPTNDPTFQPPTFTVTPTLNVSPTRLTVGDELRVDGTGYRPNVPTATITVGNAATPVTVTTDATGRLEATFPVPPTPGGPTQVAVTDQVSSLAAEVEIAPILVEASVDPNVVVEGAVPVGSTLAVRGFGFGPSEEVTIFIGPIPVVLRRPLTTSATGTVEGVVAIPPVPAGIHPVRVVGSVSGLSAQIDDVIAVLPELTTLRPSSGGPGDTVRIAAVGFGANETVRIDLNGTPLADVTTESDGHFEGPVVIQTALPDGVYDLTLTGLDSGVTLVKDGAFTVRDTRPPIIESVTIETSADPLHTGDTITITAIEKPSFETITEATYTIGTMSGALENVGGRTWQAVVPVEAGLRLNRVPVEVTLVDLAGNRGRRRASTRITLDTIVDFGNVTIDGPNPAKAGDTLTVTGTGESGGTATFTIPGIAEDLPMEESPNGTYTGTYTVQPGDRAEDVTITATFMDATGNTATVAVETPWTIDAEAVIESVTILGSPARKGETLTFIVTGDPGGSVEVQIEGLPDIIPLAEQANTPGAYRGTYDVTRREPLPDAVVHVILTDALGNRAEDTASRVTILQAREIAISLIPGVNLISIPLQDPGIQTMDDLLNRIGPDAEFVIWQGAGTGKFRFYRRDFGPDSAANGLVLPGAGYIVKMDAPGELVVTGEPWPVTQIELRAGINLIGLTRIDPALNRMSDLGTRIGLAFTQGIAYDADAGRFVAFLRDFAPGSPVDRPVRIGEAYIIQVRYRAMLQQEGPPPIAP